MKNENADDQLERVNSIIADRKRSLRDRRKRLVKSESRAVAASLMRDITALEEEVETLKIQQKALKRGIVLLDENQH